MNKIAYKLIEEELKRSTSDIIKRSVKNGDTANLTYIIDKMKNIQDRKPWIANYHYECKKAVDELIEEYPDDKEEGELYEYLFNMDMLRCYKGHQGHQIIPGVITTNIKSSIQVFTCYECGSKLRIEFNLLNGTPSIISSEWKL